MSDPLPVYTPATPHQQQNWDYDCSQESAQWCLRSWGRTPDDAWMEACLIQEGVMTPQYGLMDASGAGMADWFNRWYGEDGYVASNDGSVSFDDVAAEAGQGAHPLMLGGRAWCHWVGCSSYDPSADVLIIKNSAAGYMGVGQTLSRGQFASLGAFSMVRLTHPAAEGQGPPPEAAIDYNPWVGFVGSGLLEQMQAAGVYPVQSMSTWLPLGSPAADIEECMASDGSIFRWVMAQNRSFRYFPS